MHAWTHVVADASGGCTSQPRAVPNLPPRAAELLDTQLTPARDRHPGVAAERHVVKTPR